MRILLGVLIVVVLALVGIWLMIDSIAKAGIEQGGTYALGVKTRVDGVEVSLLAGTLEIHGLTIDNPEGYETPRLLESGRWKLDVETSSLLTDTVVFTKFELNGLDLYIEQKGKTNNISEVIENVKRLMKEEEEPSGKTLKIDRVVITDITAHVKLRSGKEPITIKVDRIELNDVTPESAKGVMISELMRKLFPAIIVGIVNEGGNVLGSAFSNQLTSDVTSYVGVLGEDAAKLVGQMPGLGEKVGRDSMKLIDEVGERVEGALKDVGKSLDDTLKGVGDIFRK